MRQAIPRPARAGWARISCLQPVRPRGSSLTSERCNGPRSIQPVPHRHFRALAARLVLRTQAEAGRALLTWAGSRHLEYVWRAGLDAG
jgi:hypothetical protein